VIVGAGMTGISAAKRLKDHFKSKLNNNKSKSSLSIKLTILEARDRIGGRIFTTNGPQQSPGSFGPCSGGVTGGVGNYPIDMGAQFIHYHKSNPLYEIARSNGIELVSASDKDYPKYVDPDGQLTHDDIIRHGKLFEKFLEERVQPSLEARFSTMEDDEPFVISLQKCIEQEMNREGSSLEMNEAVKRAWDTHLQWWAAYNAADSNELGSKGFFSTVVGDSGDMVVPQGLGQIVRVLASDLPILFNHEVFRVEIKGNKTIVSTTNGRNIVCDKVLITVPLGVLKRDRIQFIPPLPKEKQQAIQTLGYGSMSKVFLEFDEEGPWFDRSVTSFSVLPSADGKSVKTYYFLNWKKLTGKNILIAFSSGSDSREINQQPEWLTVEQVMKALRVVYPTIPQPDRFKIAKWDNDPYSYGAYGYSAVGSNTQTFVDYEATIDKKIYFGGEATSALLVGYAHGAYFSGILEAEKMLVDMGLPGAAVNNKNPIILSRL